MSVMNELATVKDELIRCSETLRCVSDTLNELAHSWEVSLSHEETPVHEEKSVLSLADVRACLAQKSVEGHTNTIQALIRKYGAEKLSQVDPKHYAALLAEAEVL